eukprot:TRINITY_DN19954_c0_g3_i1.p1 TRINITY_DN19954_c0_g3~~TRINITY_DN19954_c0_g3_i1.p1  ORF type:complete len:232 (+),score=46.43 TRINITY_DN19954_c0_g3_i1:41-697(+)
MAEDKDALYRRGLQCKAELEAALEGLAGQKGEVSVAVQQRLSAQAQEFERVVDGLRTAVASLPEKGRMTWDRRVANLADDAASLNGAIEKQIGVYFRVRKEEDMRNALFGDRNAAGGSGGADDGTKALLKERSSLQQSAMMLDEIIGQGRGILDNVVGQNKVLKGARRKLLDAANVMGVSSSLVNVIDRRQTGDRWLVYGGMALVLFLLFSLWYLLKM